MAVADDQDDEAPTSFTTSMLYRRVNDEILELHQRFRSEADTLSLVCECSDASCAAPITMTLRDYRELRSSLTHFAIASVHESSTDERVQTATDTYRVITWRESVDVRRLA